MIPKTPEQSTLARLERMSGVSTLLTMAAVLAFSPSLARAAQKSVMENSVRTVTDLKDGWLFQYGDAPDTAHNSDFDDSGWEKVSVPHTWNHVGYMTTTRGADANANRGVAWYRLKHSLPEVAKDRRYILQFDGVAIIAEVWVNGTRVGDHKGSFARFRLDVTDQLKPGADNLIAIKVDNSKPAIGSTTADIVPLGGDYFVFGGLYRAVSLISTESAQIDMLDHAGPGVYIRTPSVSPDKAEVEVVTKLRNFGSEDRKLTVSTTILDAAGKAVASDSAPMELAKSSTAEVRRTISLAKPHLWNGRTDPYLYKVAIELKDGTRVVDSIVQPLGVRTFAFDPDKGFILNGKPTPLHGVSRHQDWQDKGWALSPEDHAKDMELIVELGANTIRHAHYQHAQEWSDAADKAGMIVWAEVPYTHETSYTHDEPTEATVENAKNQVVELIRQNYNHPSIAIWCVGNEIDMGALVAALRSGGKGKLPKSSGLLTILGNLAQAEDNSRPTAYADCTDQSASQFRQPGMEILSGLTGITGYNRYFGWYYGVFEDMGPALDKLHRTYPKLPIGVSEYGAGAGVTQHTDHPRGGPISSGGRPHPEEFQSLYHELNWPQLKQRPYLFGTWIWNMFDFAAPRAEGDTIDINDKGLVTRDRKIRKDAFYFYKANWSTEPVLYLTGRRYVDRAYPVVDVRAYSNAPKAELKVNGKWLGEASTNAEHILVWKNVRLDVGVNNVEVVGELKGQRLSDRVTWNAPDAESGLHIRVGTLEGVISGGRRFGSDSFFVGGSGKSLSKLFRGMGKKVVIANTPTPEIFEGYREGSFRYELPLPDGKWKVTLHFADPNETKAESRTFDITADGKIAVADFCPAKTAGGINKAAVCEFPVEVKGGMLKLEFLPKAGDAIVSAIVVTR